VTGNINGMEPYPGFNPETDFQCLVCGNFARIVYMGDNEVDTAPFTLGTFTDTEDQLPVQLNVQAQGVSCNYSYAP